MILDIVFIILGFILLIKGGDYLIDGSVSIAKHAKLSNLVIGLTVIGFGTSAPELLVSSQAALMGSSGIAIGNVVGSNIANIALILGLTAMIYPITATKTMLNRDMPFMMLSVLLLVLIGCYGTITRFIGLLFIVLIIAFVWWQIISCRNADSNSESTDEITFKEISLAKAIVIAVVSICALIAGANILIKGAVGIALLLGTSERIIGLTIVAVGTSLPELFATVMAAKKHQSDMALGNIIGSVTFNILCVIGVSSLLCPIMNANAGFLLDYAVMLILSIILYVFLRTNHLLERWEGTVLLLIYVAYLINTIV